MSDRAKFDLELVDWSRIPSVEYPADAAPASTSTDCVLVPSCETLHDGGTHCNRCGCRGSVECLEKRIPVFQPENVTNILPVQGQCWRGVVDSTGKSFGGHHSTIRPAPFDRGKKNSGGGTKIPGWPILDLRKLDTVQKLYPTRNRCSLPWPPAAGGAPPPRPPMHTSKGAPRAKHPSMGTRLETDSVIEIDGDRQPRRKCRCSCAAFLRAHATSKTTPSSKRARLSQGVNPFGLVSAPGTQAPSLVFDDVRQK